MDPPDGFDFRLAASGKFTKFDGEPDGVFVSRKLSLVYCLS